MVARTVHHAAGILGLDVDAPFADVRRAYRRLLFGCHPDHNPDATGALCAARVRQICLAFELVTADRNGAVSVLVVRQFERVTEEIDVLLAAAAARRTAATAGTDTRFVPAAEQRGHRLDIAA